MQLENLTNNIKDGLKDGLKDYYIALDSIYSRFEYKPVNEHDKPNA